METKQHYIKIFALLAVCALVFFWYKKNHTTRIAEKNTNGTHVIGSRDPEEGCEWQPLFSEKFGLGLLVQTCPLVKTTFAFTDKGVAMQTNNNTASTTHTEILASVFDKNETETIEKAIQRTFFSTMTQEQQYGCMIVPMQEYALLDEHKKLYQIVPNDAFKQAKKGKVPEGASLCGLYGDEEALQYIEYHPDQTKKKFLFVRFGEEIPLFDEQSFEFIDTSKIPVQVLQKNK